MTHPEYHLQRQVCAYIRNAYPSAMFMSDTIGSVHLNPKQANRNSAIQKKGFKTPDIIIFKPNAHYNALFIELKSKTPFKLNGELKKDEHLLAQGQSIAQLNALGYLAVFCWSFDQARKVIDNYMNNKL
jgi:hypothetical protein